LITLSLASGPAGAQMTVYDPSNYAQNVLQAARALQQINNQINSLQNQTQMLLNQARNLASLPYSSLQTIEQSITRTQQLINQAQRLAYDTNQIDQEFQRTYPELLRLDILAAAHRRCPDALAEFSGRVPGRPPRTGRRRASVRYHAHRNEW